MSSRRLHLTLLIILGVLVLGLLGGTYVFAHLLSQKAQTLAKERQQIAILDGRQSALTKAKADVKKYQQLATIAKSIVPQDKDQAQTIGEIVKLASQNNVRLGSFVFPSSTLGAAGAATSKAALSQLEPVKGIPGVYGLQIVVQSDTNHPAAYYNFLHFLESIEQNRRTALVTGISITPDPKNPAAIGFSLTLEEYIKP